MKNLVSFFEGGKALEIRSKFKQVVVFLIIAFLCGVAVSCMEGSVVGILTGVLLGIAATLMYPMFKAWYHQHFDETFSIYKLDSWYRFMKVFPICLSMIIFNFWCMSDSYGFIDLNEDNSSLHVAIVLAVTVVAAVCIIVISFYVHTLILDCLLGSLRGELQIPVGNGGSVIFALIGNAFLCNLIREVRARDAELGTCVFFLYQMFIGAVAFVFAILLLRSRVLHEKAVKEVQCAGETLPTFVLQGKKSLIHKDGKIELRGCDGILITKSDGANLQYQLRLVDNVFLWSKEVH